ncbi:MFS transporter, partial [Streptomyces sp. WAC07061]|uniref:MFS transporter n=1 Tax=Streptomyces sp. WAC07061 TaxID=2487410 RepID=UPI0021B08BB9
MKRAFGSLSVRNFRLFFLGQLLSVTCTWMMVIAQDWLVLELSGDSGTALGVVTALQFTPVLLLTLYGGRLADRHSKRRILILANLTSGTLALALGLWVVRGDVRLWHIWLFALLLGAVNSVEAPTRIAFVGEMVGNELLPNASALSGAYFNAARVAGPAVAGLLIARLGVGPVILLNACSYLAAVAGLALMRPAELGLGQQRERQLEVEAGQAQYADQGEGQDQVGAPGDVAEAVHD